MCCFVLCCRCCDCCCCAVCVSGQEWLSCAELCYVGCVVLAACGVRSCAVLTSTHSLLGGAHHDIVPQKLFSPHSGETKIYQKIINNITAAQAVDREFVDIVCPLGLFWLPVD